jgi:hypothetical protein
VCYPGATSFRNENIAGYSTQQVWAGAIGQQWGDKWERFGSQLEWAFSPKRHTRVSYLLSRINCLLFSSRAAPCNHKLVEKIRQIIILIILLIIMVIMSLCLSMSRHAWCLRNYLTQLFIVRSMAMVADVRWIGFRGLDRHISKTPPMPHIGK